MPRYETYQSNAAEIPIMRKWILRALILSLILHVGLLIFFYFKKLENFGNMGVERLAPPVRVMTRVNIPKIPDEEVKMVIPSHYATFPILTGTPGALREELSKRSYDCEVIEMKLGGFVGTLGGSGHAGSDRVCGVCRRPIRRASAPHGRIPDARAYAPLLTALAPAAAAMTRPRRNGARTQHRVAPARREPTMPQMMTLRTSRGINLAAAVVRLRALGATDASKPRRGTASQHTVTRS